MRIALRRLISLGWLTGVACADPTAPARGPLQTDADTYTAVAVGSGQVEVRLILTYRNPADTVVKLDHCVPAERYPVYTVELVAPASSDGAAYNPGWACVGGVSPLIVDAGATRTDTITLHGPTVYDNTAQRYVGVLTGTFRIGFGGQESNVFAIKLPAGGVTP